MGVERTDKHHLACRGSAVGPVPTPQPSVQPESESGSQLGQTQPVELRVASSSSHMAPEPSADSSQAFAASSITPQASAQAADGKVRHAPLDSSALPTSGLLHSREGFACFSIGCKCLRICSDHFYVPSSCCPLPTGWMWRNAIGSAWKEVRRSSMMHRAVATESKFNPSLFCRAGPIFSWHKSCDMLELMAASQHTLPLWDMGAVGGWLGHTPAHPWSLDAV